MAVVCHTCSRVNPDEARYCYQDGSPLGNGTRNGGPVAVSAQPFLSPFVFPSGRSCRSFDELVLACDAEWDEAKNVIKEGYLEGFLGGLGRTDLAQAARQAKRAPDLDRALDDFLTKLPGGGRQPARLAVQPLEVNLGQVSRTVDRRFVLHLENQGMGLLYGTVAADDTPWLALGDPPGSGQKLFQCHHELSVPVLVAGKRLRAGDKPQEGRLVIESNGGTVTVVVRVEMPIQPFPEGVLAGARTPRQIAEKAKAAPKDAAILFEKGAVAAWYEANGWTYPVQGPASSGLGAVQQFFEALGLVTPPKVEISTQCVNLQGRPGETLEYSILVQAVEKRPVFAHAVSQAPWLRIGRVQLQGQAAQVPLLVPAVPATPGQRLTGKVQVVANGNQRFSVEVGLTVAAVPPPPPVRSSRVSKAVPASIEALAAPSAAAAPPEVEVFQFPSFPTPPPVRKSVRASTFTPPPDEDDEELVAQRPSRRVHLLPILFLLVCLLVTFAHDLVTWVKTPGPIEDKEVLVDKEPRIALNFHDTKEKVELGFGGVKPIDGSDPTATRTAEWEPSMRFGLVMLKEDDPKHPGRAKRLTFEEKGLTNNTVVRLDGHEWIFGDRPFRPLSGPPLRENWPGRWLNQDVPLATNPERGRKSVWVYEEPKIHVTQIVEIVPGAQSGLLDTGLVRYRLENKDTRMHHVGLRFLLDTYIGGNDGVPFLIPGSHELCATSKEFVRPEEVPDFIQACENEDLKNPGTVAQIQLRVAGLESPSRVTLGAWPNPELGRRDERCKQEKTLWEVPVFPIHTLNPADSAVTIYWNEKPLQPGQSREVGFAYGLGSVAGGEGGGKLALTVGGSFVPGGEFTVTAYVSNPAPLQHVTLTLPEGFTLLAGTAEQAVPPLPPGAESRNSPVTWKVRAGPKEGKYPLKVQSGNIVQTQPLRIRVKGIFGNN
jgi:hypothetical protein